MRIAPSAFAVVMSLVGASTVQAAARPKVLIDADTGGARLVSAAIAKKFMPVPFKGVLSDAPTAKEVRDACRPDNAIAVIQVRGVKMSHSIQALNCSDGTVLDSFKFKVAKFKALPPKVGPALNAALQNGAPAAAEKAAPVAAAEPEKKAAPVEQAKADPAPAPEKKPTPAPVAAKKAAPVVEAKTEPVVTETKAVEEPLTRSPLPMMRASLGMHGFNRTFGVTGDPSQSIGTYGGDLHGAVLVDAQLFPGAALTSSFVSNLGVFGQADIGLGISAKPKSGDARFPISSQRIRTGAIVRIPVSSAFEIDLHAGFSTQSFAVAALATDGVTERPNLPAVTYNGFRGGAGFRFDFSERVGIDLMLGAVAASKLGEIASAAFFPKATAFGLDGNLGLNIRLMEGLEAKFAVDYARYIVKLNPQEGAEFTATAAADQYIGGTVSLGWVL